MEISTDALKELPTCHMDKAEPQDVPVGYRRTKAGVIPEDWEAKTISDVVSFSGGTQPPRSSFVFGPKEGYVRLIQIRDYKSEDFATYAPESWPLKRCTSRDVMIGRYGPPIFQILRGIEGAYNVALIKSIPTKDLDVEYWYYYVGQDRLFRLIDSLSRRSSGQTGVEMSALKAFGIPLPPLSEQRTIAKALSDVDELLGALEALITKKRSIKKAAMQQLLTGKTRLPGFSEKWVRKKITEIAIPSGERNTTRTDLPVLTCSKHLGFVDSLGYFKNQVFSHDLSSYKIIRRGQIGYPANHIEEGSIGLQDLYDTALVSPIYVVFRPEGVSGYFLHRLLKLDFYREKFATATNSSVDRRGSLRWPAFSEIAVTIPSREEEQLAIATALSDMENEIAALEARRNKTRAIKQGMMQQLLTGRIRLVKPEQAEVTA